jgi:hypothetical protein
MKLKIKKPPHLYVCGLVFLLPLVFMVSSFKKEGVTADRFTMKEVKIFRPQKGALIESPQQAAGYAKLLLKEKVQSATSRNNFRPKRWNLEVSPNDHDSWKASLSSQGVLPSYHCEVLFNLHGDYLTAGRYRPNPRCTFNK